jgi:hypothetical protein
MLLAWVRVFIDSSPPGGRVLMAVTNPKELEFQEGVLHALDIERRKEQLEIFKTLLEASDYFPAGHLLGEEADHLKKPSKMLLNWQELSRDERGE